MIDFKKFTAEQTFIAPVFNQACQYNRKKYSIQSSDGWKNITVRGNEVISCQETIIENLTMKNVIKGYTYNNNIIFQNFDVAKRKAGKDIMSGLNFNQSPTFSSVEAIVWEDKNIYYYKPNYSDILIYEVKAHFDSESELDSVKGVSPELRTLYLFHEIERQHIRDSQQKIKREKEIEEFKQTIQGRLITTFNRAGAKILNYSVLKDRIVVDWKLTDSTTEFNSVIELSTFRIIESGYCMSSDDRRHSVSSMIVTAKDYEEQGLIYKTRH